MSPYMSGKATPSAAPFLFGLILWVQKILVLMSEKSHNILQIRPMMVKYDLEGMRKGFIKLG
jgi:hypothetical protein